MKILCLSFMLFLMACESKRLIFKTDIVLKDSVQFDLKRDLGNFGLIVKGDKIHPNLEKNCIGILESNSVLICKNNLNVMILSFYKITDKNKSMDLEVFMADKKKGEEEKSYTVHIGIVEDFKIKSSRIENSLTAKGDLLAILNVFSN